MNDYHIGKPNSTYNYGNTDTVNLIKIQFAQAVEKEPRHYEKAKNPLTLYKSNFHASNTLHISKPDFFELVRAKDHPTLEMLRQEAKNRGYQGEIIVQAILGGLGRKRFVESVEAYRARRQSGMPEIVRIWVD